MADVGRDWIKGFWSEVRGNDPNFDRMLMRLNAGITNAFMERLNANFELFRDPSLREQSEDWLSAVEEHLESSDFLIPILTPRYFERRKTRTELKRFLAREDPMVFPILYMGDLLNPETWDQNTVFGSESAEDDLVRRLSTFQILDFREHRFEPETPAATALMSEFVERIIARVQTPPLREPPVAAQPDSTPPPLTTELRSAENSVPNKPRDAVKLFRPEDMPGWHPLASGHPPSWASGWGQDEHGIFVEVAVNGVTFAMRWCPKGSFLMGSSENEPAREDNESPQVKVQFAKGFWIGETTVTQAVYEAVKGDKPSHFEGLENPVEQVSWQDAKGFSERLNEMVPGLNIDLPTEAQWEYACRAGTSTRFSPHVVLSTEGNLPTIGEVNYNGNYPIARSSKGKYRQRTVAAQGEPFSPNAWGIWHMHGNVWEWCEDVWARSHDGAASDGSPRQGSKQDGERLRVLRGGSWNGFAGACRAASRRRSVPGFRLDSIGFRLARGQ